MIHFKGNCLKSDAELVCILDLDNSPFPEDCSQFLKLRQNKKQGSFAIGDFPDGKVALIFAGDKEINEGALRTSFTSLLKEVIRRNIKSVAFQSLEDYQISCSNYIDLLWEFFPQAEIYKL